MSNQKTEQVDEEAVYYSALSLLDDLPYASQCLVALNWVKYVLLSKAEEITQEHSPRTIAAYRRLCADFARQVAELPDRLLEMVADEVPCGHCPGCIEAGPKPSEPALADETAN